MTALRKKAKSGSTLLTDLKFLPALETAKRCSHTKFQPNWLKNDDLRAWERKRGVDRQKAPSQGHF